jgi:hypothetical protein
MAQLKLLKYISLSGLAVVLSCGIILHSGIASHSIAAAPQPTVRLTTLPEAGQLLPFEAESATPQFPVEFKLEAVDAAGSPIPNARFRLRVLTPAPTPWLTTDFPIVEGTKLLDMEAIAPSGVVNLQQMLPIRGDYRIEAEVTPLVPGQFASFQQTFILPVAEHAAKYRNSVILALVVLAMGIAGGWVIGEQQQIQPGEFAPRRVQILLSGAAIVAIVALLIINLGELMPHGDHHHSAAEVETPARLQAQGLELYLSGDTSAIVGQPATLIAEVKEVATGQPPDDVVLNLKVTQLEDGWTTLAYQGRLDAQGRFTWQQQFFDGAPHQVWVELQPQPQSQRQFQPFHVARSIEVEGVEPPLLTRLISLFYLSLILLVGMGLGFWWRSPNRKKV